VRGTAFLDRHVGWEPEPREPLALSGFALLTLVGVFSVAQTIALWFVVPLLLGCVLALVGGVGAVRGWHPARWLRLVGLGAVNIGAVAVATVAVGVSLGSLVVVLYLTVPTLVGAAVLGRGLWLLAAAQAARQPARDVS
jgi:hypothetical protein